MRVFVRACEHTVWAVGVPTQPVCLDSQPPPLLSSQPPQPTQAPTSLSSASRWACRVWTTPSCPAPWAGSPWLRWPPTAGFRRALPRPAKPLRKAWPPPWRPPAWRCRLWRPPWRMQPLGGGGGRRARFLARRPCFASRGRPRWPTSPPPSWRGHPTLCSAMPTCARWRWWRCQGARRPARRPPSCCAARRPPPWPPRPTRWWRRLRLLPRRWRQAAAALPPAPRAGRGGGAPIYLPDSVDGGWGILPSGAGCALIQPVPRRRGGGGAPPAALLVVAGDRPGALTSRDRAWVAALAAKMGGVLG